MLNGLGIETGVDLGRLVEIGQWICGVLGREPATRAGRAIAAKRSSAG
jgi:hydroxymethylglutaryl-CoA lyase